MKRRVVSTSANVLDEWGEPVRYQHHELPEQDLELTAGPYNPAELAAVAHAWSEDVWQERHGDCEASWDCGRCGRRVCPRCDPSPGEFTTCAECHDFGGAA